MSDEIKKPEELEKNKNFDESDDSHEYDGIKELNNPAPFWIMAIFIITIGFSMFYVIHNFGYPGNKMDQESRYDRSVSDFEEKIKSQTAGKDPVTGNMSQEQLIQAGSALYLSKGCIACHGTSGEGNNIGPNLTDNYWLNGCSTEEITAVIRDGRPAKGMTPYKSVMTEEQIGQLVSFIKLSLVGSEPANQKEPQGELCE
jgi:cytochrome c oxidase cbb3-type subunit 3